MKCPNCNNAIPDSSPYCAYCGTRIQPGRLQRLPDWSRTGIGVAILAISGVMFLGGLGLWVAATIGPRAPQVPQLTEHAATPEQVVSPTSLPTSVVLPTNTPTIPTPTSVPPTPTPPRPTPTLTPTHMPIPTPLPVERMIESFESYGSNRALRAPYSINAPENNGSISLAVAPNVYRGSQALAFAYTIHTIVPAGGYTVTDYAGLIREFAPQDWRGFNYLRLWVRSDGSNKDLVVQFHEASGEVWKYTTSLSSFVDKDLQLSLSTNVFHLAEWTPAVNNQIDLGSITGYSIYVGHSGTGQGTIYVDAIRLSE